jgi:hypothetical protein
VSRSRYDWKPEVFQELDIANSLTSVINPILQGFGALHGKELLMYRTVKLNIFFGRFDWHADQILVSWESENFVIFSEERALTG